MTHFKYRSFNCRFYSSILIKIFLYIIIWLPIEGFGGEDPSIAFVHIGEHLPRYLETAIYQALLFNEDIPIFVVAEKRALREMHSTLAKYQVKEIAFEILQKTREHRLFLSRKGKCSGFFRCTCERFLYLYDLISQYHLKNVFHLENDNLLYVDIKKILPQFCSVYPGIAVTFDNDNRCIPGFVYVANKNTMQKLALFFADKMPEGYNDMQIIAMFKDTVSHDIIDWLPIAPIDYALSYPLVSFAGCRVSDSKKISNNFQIFDSIFDAAAIGQYLGGGDRRYFPNALPGFINESSVFNPGVCSYEWIVDNENRKIPHLRMGSKLLRINNLHIHSKQLDLFVSKTR